MVAEWPITRKFCVAPMLDWTECVQNSGFSVVWRILGVLVIFNIVALVEL